MVISLLYCSGVDTIVSIGVVSRVYLLVQLREYIDIMAGFGRDWVPATVTVLK